MDRKQQNAKEIFEELEEATTNLEEQKIADDLEALLDETLNEEKEEKKEMKVYDEDGNVVALSDMEEGGHYYDKDGKKLSKEACKEMIHSMKKESEYEPENEEETDEMKGKEDDEFDHVATTEDLSPAEVLKMKHKAQKVFESAVDLKVSEIRKELEEEKDREVESISEALEKRIDSYCDYVVSEWIDNNRFQVENALKHEISENFIHGLRDLFAENYFSVPEDKADLCESLAETVSSLKEDKQDLIRELDTANQALLESNKQSIIESVGSDLFDTQKAKLTKLAESIDASDVEDFEDKLASIKEVFFSEAPSKKVDLEESMVESPTKNLQESGSGVGAYLDFLNKTSK